MTEEGRWPELFGHFAEYTDEAEKALTKIRDAEHYRGHQDIVSCLDGLLSAIVVLGEAMASISSISPRPGEDRLDVTARLLKKLKETALHEAKKPRVHEILSPSKRFISDLYDAAQKMLSELAASGLLSGPGEKRLILAASELRKALTAQPGLPVGFKVKTTWDDQPELQNGPIPLDDKARESVRKTRLALHHLVQGAAPGAQLIHDAITVDYTALELRILALILERTKTDFDPTWAATVKEIAEKLFHLPATTGMDQAHSDTLEDVSKWLEKAGNALELGPDCKHEVWDFVPGCEWVRCADCSEAFPVTEEHKKHNPYKDCGNPKCRQCRIEGED
jgi:hypothetical protein